MITPLTPSSSKFPYAVHIDTITPPLPPIVAVFSTLEDFREWGTNGAYFTDVAQYNGTIWHAVKGIYHCTTKHLLLNSGKTIYAREYTTPQHHPIHGVTYRVWAVSVEH